MLKTSNKWISDSKEKGLYFGCYDDRLTIKIGQTLKGIYKRSQEIDMGSLFGFTIQYYIPFTHLQEDKKKNTIFALAMEDLVHDWMTQFCNTKDFHKYRGEDHYECSVEACERFFNYFENHEKEITDYFIKAGEKLHSIIDNFEFPNNEKVTNSNIVISILRIYNNVQEEHGRFIDCFQYNRRTWMAILAWEKLGRKRKELFHNT